MGQKLDKKEQEIKESFSNLWESCNPEEIPKVICIEHSLEFDKDFQHLLWDHATSSLCKSETNGIVERTVSRVTADNSTFYYNPDSMNNGGQNLWNVIATYAMSRIFFSDKETQLDQCFEEHFGGRIIPVGAKSKINCWQQKIKQESSSRHGSTPDLLMDCDLQT